MNHAAAQLYFIHLRTTKDRRFCSLNSWSRAGCDVPLTYRDLVRYCTFFSLETSFNGLLVRGIVDGVEGVALLSSLLLLLPHLPVPFVSVLSRHVHFFCKFTTVAVLHRLFESNIIPFEPRDRCPIDDFKSRSTPYRPIPHLASGLTSQLLEIAMLRMRPSSPLAFNVHSCKLSCTLP